MELHLDVTPDVDVFASEWQKAGSVVEAEMMSTMRATVLVVEAQGKATSPVKTGTLRRSITNQVSGGGGAVVGIVGTNVPYAIYVHEGTRARVIVPVNKKALYWPGARHPVRRVNHPGITANPFLRRALQQKRGDIMTLWRGLARRALARMG